MKLTTTFILSFLVTVTFGQSLSDEIDRIYTFKPHQLSREEQESKLPALESFWNKVKSDTIQYLPQLRYELSRERHNPFFYFDGSALLLTLSQDSIDKNISAKAIEKCNLEDISQQMYVATLNSLAHDGIDVTKAAVKILSYDKYSFFLPQHAMTFNQGYCLTYMLLPQKASHYVDTLISIFPIVSMTAKKSIITTLWFSYSCKGDEFIKSVIANQTVDKVVRVYAEEIMSHSKLTKDQKEYIKIIGKENLNELRLMSLKRFSDEAISDLDITTRVLRNEQKCH